MGDYEWKKEGGGEPETEWHQGDNDDYNDNDKDVILFLSGLQFPLGEIIRLPKVMFIEYIFFWLKFMFNDFWIVFDIITAVGQRGFFTSRILKFVFFFMKY